MSGGFGPLAPIAVHLSRAETRAELARCEAAERFPADVVAQVTELGRPQLFAAAGDARYTTAYHLNALGAIGAQASGSLAIPLGIAGLALLPVYIAGTDEQPARVRERILAGAQAAMLLSEWHGSHLTASETRAGRGRLEAGGGFAPAAAGQAADVYWVSGEKQLINLGRRAELLMTLARTSPAGAGLLGAGGLSLFLIERDVSVEVLPRWRTLPVPAADNGRARFRGTLVPVGSRTGDEGIGFRLARRALAMSCGGICAFASGAASPACGLAFAHSRERILYGQPIARLAPVADHLALMAAFDLTSACLSVTATAAVNALGQRAAHLTAVAKLVACDFAERAVNEGRAVVSARPLFTDLPYQQAFRDVILYGIFDSTRHLMLDQIRWRARQMCGDGPAAGAKITGAPTGIGARMGVAAAGGEGASEGAGAGAAPRRGAGTSDGGGMNGAAEASEDGSVRAAIYGVAPVNLVDAARRSGRPVLVRPSETAARLARQGGAAPLAALADGARALERATGSLPAEAWSDPAVGFALAETWARLEAALAVAELGDPGRRAALGLPGLSAAAGADSPPLDAAELARFAVALVAGEALADARMLLAGGGVDLGADAAEKALAGQQAAAGRAVRDAIRGWR